MLHCICVCILSFFGFIFSGIFFLFVRKWIDGKMIVEAMRCYMLPRVLITPVEIWSLMVNETLLVSFIMETKQRKKVLLWELSFPNVQVIFEEKCTDHFPFYALQISCHTLSRFFLNQQSVIAITSRSPKMMLKKLLIGRIHPQNKSRYLSSLLVFFCR